MEEKKIYYEIPGGKNKFHSAILTSYSFNFHHFEYQVLKALKHKYITNIGVLADTRMLDKSIGLTSSGLQQLTQSYSVNGISCEGAFHPKINFIAGDNEALVIFGSGNISPSGHGKNHETFTVFYVDSKESPFLPIINEVWDYIKSIAKDLQGFSKERITSSIPMNCDVLGHSIDKKHQFYRADDDLEVALVYNNETSILNQLTNLIPAPSVEIISIVSPYFDEDGALLMLLLDIFPNAKLEVFIPKENGLPPTMIETNSRINFYNWEETKRGQTRLKGNESFYRSLHSKVFQFSTSDYNYFLIGSANATIAGFGNLEKRGKNEEFGALYKSSKTDFFRLLDITNSKIIRSLSDFQRSVKLGPETISKKSISRVKIVACDLIGSRMHIYFIGSISASDHEICFFNDQGKALFEKELNFVNDSLIQISIGLTELHQNPIYIQIISKDGESASNKQLINHNEKLFHTDPSKENRTIRSLIGALEIGRINEFEILNYINELNSSETPLKTSSSGSRTVAEEKNQIIFHPEMTYAEAMKASNDSELVHKISQTHNTIRIWEVLTKLFNEKEQRSTSELNDEEEEASVSISNERTTSIDESEGKELTDDKQCNSLLRKTEKLSHDYINTLEKINVDTKAVINEVHLCQFLLVTHILTAIHRFTDYDLTFKNKKTGSYNAQSWVNELTNTYYINTRATLIAFSKFVISHEVEVIESNELRSLKLQDYKHKVISHLLIYHYLINHNKEKNPASQLLNLICLNIFDKLGLPDSDTDKYIELIAKTKTTHLFNYSAVIKLKKDLVQIFENIGQDSQYFRERYRGICFIIEENDSKVTYKSVFEPDSKLEVSVKDFKKVKL
jgi:hypothetical protein